MLILAVIHDFSYLRCGGLQVWWLDEFFSSDTEKMLLNSELVSQFRSTSQCYAYPAVFGASCLFFFFFFLEQVVLWTVRENSVSYLLYLIFNTYAHNLL